MNSKTKNYRYIHQSVNDDADFNMPMRYVRADIRQKAQADNGPRYIRQKAQADNGPRYIRQRQNQRGGAGPDCPDPITQSTRTKKLIAAMEELNNPSPYGQGCFRLYQYIDRYGPITLTAAAHPECDYCVIYENGLPIASSSYLQ